MRIGGGKKHGPGQAIEGPAGGRSVEGGVFGALARGDGAETVVADGRGSLVHASLGQKTGVAPLASLFVTPPPPPPRLGHATPPQSAGSNNPPFRLLNDPGHGAPHS